MFAGASDLRASYDNFHSVYDSSEGAQEQTSIIQAYEQVSECLCERGGERLREVNDESPSPVLFSERMPIITVEKDRKAKESERDEDGMTRIHLVFALSDFVVLIAVSNLSFLCSFAILHFLTVLSAFRLGSIWLLLSVVHRAVMAVHARRSSLSFER